jgi:hypothetical protein
MTLFGRFLGRRGKPKEPAAPRAAPSTPRGIACQMADSVADAVADPGGLSTLMAIARLWRTPEERLPDELMALDTFAVEFALDQVLMSESLRVELREEFRAAIADNGVDVKAMLARHAPYAARIAADKQQAQSGAMMHSLADSVGAVFVQALGAENALLADAVGRRFIDNTEALREYLEGSLRMLWR